MTENRLPLSLETGPRLEELQTEIGYFFLHRRLLELALCHESFANEQEDGVTSNERLEFLGDAVLGLVVSRYLYETHPDVPEGKLAQMKAFLVSTRHLAKKAQRFHLGNYLRLGRGEQLSEGRQRSSLLADAFEALIGAVFLDGGLEAATGLVLRYLAEDMEECDRLSKDYKSQLQEITQRHFKALPRYHVLSESGPPHDRIFLVQVRFGGSTLGEGSGRSKREASQNAAAQAVVRIEQGDAVWQRLLSLEPSELPSGCAQRED
ncbi:MAG: ribonuclease III [Armatimonadetes bacterium]|nr:ribonuclease III [Armatimonadota bacterium]